MDGPMHIEACRTASGGGLRYYHGQPHSNKEARRKGGIDETDAGEESAAHTVLRMDKDMSLTCKAATAVTFSNYSAKEAKNNPGLSGISGAQSSF